MSDERDDIRRRDEASAWFAKMNQRRVSSDDVKRFSAWRRDPANASAFAKVEAVWDASDRLRRDPDVLAALDDARARSASKSRPERRKRFGLAPAGAVMAVLALVCVAGVAYVIKPDEFETATGERRTVRLEDGSRIVLDTQTHLAVRMNGDSRRISLTRGQAYFEVARDEHRPFTVQAGDTLVTAIGTRFDVRRLESGAQVVLTHGQVSVSQGRDAHRRWRLDPGEGISTTADNPVVAAVDVDRALSWTSGRLVFDRTTVAAAVAEMNRYSESTIEVTDPAVAAERISGAFDAGDSDALAAALLDVYPLSERRTGDRITLSRARTPAD